MPVAFHNCFRSGALRGGAIRQRIEHGGEFGDGGGIGLTRNEAFIILRWHAFAITLPK